MEYEFDSLTELPPIPQVYDPIMESLPPLPSSDFIITPPSFSDHYYNYNNHVQDLLNLHQHVPDSVFLDSTLSLLTRHHISESTRLDNLFNAVFSDEATTPFLRLPDLKSFDDQKPSPLPFLSLSPKRRRFNISQQSPSSSAGTSSNTIDTRKKISDKIRSLEKVMPWEKKMSLATILEETHKYITFLQSQIASLFWMPLDSAYSTTTTVDHVRETQLLKSLTRQQILQVIANSPGARTELYTRGLCVFSYEQLLSLKMMTQSVRNNL
ncbi:hypothetical protein AALP_AA3G252700 [Arabis alpina]|uniref:BHLH domain-containing protein n=1 Tax=Arabis alpina TaxID=50452 RepID=A0A087HBK5_ARAAL|nr:hypothetical protein AALP_AA3G252700 [Arabis alpina]